MTRFRPTVEPLDARDLPSAVVADMPLAPPPADVAHSGDLSDQPATGDEPILGLNYTKIMW